MMAALAGVPKEDDKEITKKMFQSGDVNKQVDDVSKQVSIVTLKWSSWVWLYESVITIVESLLFFVLHNQTGQSPLMLAVSRGRMEMVEICLEAGADINAQDEVRLDFCSHSFNATNSYRPS